MNVVRRDAFQAIADPNRRAIISLLAKQEMTLNQVAENFRISRPAISKHIKVLEESGLVEIRKQGRERFCSVRLERLSEVSAWIEQYRRFREESFDRPDKYLRDLSSEQKMSRKTRNSDF